MSFSPDYNTARERFRQTVDAAGGKLYLLELDSKGPSRETLSIDVGWFGAEIPRRVLLHSSGLHGVEGFAGSAIQLHVMRNLPPDISRTDSDSALVLVHILNPYGMAGLRRVNESNVDLNRNFVGDGDYSGPCDAYAELDSFLNPKSPPANDLYLFRAAGLILRHGFAKLKQAVAGGQYDFPRGLFYGGATLEEGPRKYQAFIAERLRSAEYVSAIDVHTGLGAYGRDTILPAAEDYQALREVYGSRVFRSDAAESPAYRVEGGLGSIIPALLPAALVMFLTQEFGTYNPIKVLGVLRQENRWHHYGNGEPGHPARQNLLETFCPAAASWRQSVMSRGCELVLREWERLAARDREAVNLESGTQIP